MTKEDKLIKLPEVLRLTTLGKSTWYAGIRDGIYPAPVRLGKKRVAWKLSSIKALISGE